MTAGPSDEVVSSRLLQTELTRALRREGREVAEREDILDYIATIPITDAILTAAEAITEHVKTLDAVHLASALALGSSVTLVSYDTTLFRLAGLLGVRAFDPISEQGRA